MEETMTLLPATMKKVLLGVMSMLLITLCADAQRITIQGPTRVAAGQQFQVQYSINTTDVRNFKIGNVPEAFEIIYGPSRSVQQSFNIINGRTSQSSSVMYTYVVLAKRNGTFVFPSAHAVVSGSNVSSQALRINVSGRVSGNQQGGGGAVQQQPSHRVDRAGSRISGKDLFIRVTANKQRVHEQEPILLTYKVYTQVELTQLNGKMPDLNGFHTQEIPLPQQKTFHIENVNGKPYRCVTWSQYVMFPQMAGKLEIPSITFKGIVMQENPNVDPFEAFFNGGSGYIEVKKEIKAPSVTIQVDPLPAKPTNFSGGVGRFSVSASLDKNTVKAGDPVNLRIVVSGTGNMKLIKQPEIDLPKDFDKYDAKITDKTKLVAEGLTGSMVYDILIVPRNKGEYTIPSLDFVYFDTSTSSYKTITTKPMSLTVEKGNYNGGVSDYSQRNDNDISDLLNGSTAKENPYNTFFGTTGYGIINAVIFVVFLILLIVFRKRAVALSDMAAVRGRKANKVAVKRLKKAAKLMNSNNDKEFYDEVLRALWGYVGDKLTIPVEQLSRDNISEKLQQKNVEESVIRSFIESIDECEFARYAPSSAVEEANAKMRTTYDKATEAITNIEEGMKTQKTQKSFDTAIIIVLLACATTSYAGNERANADAAYRAGDYQKAVELYHKDLAEGVTAESYHNAGNAYYRMGNIPRAILHYERALKIAPTNERIQHSMEIARNKTLDRLPGDTGMFFTQWYKAVVNVLTVDVWGYLAIASLVLALLSFLMYLFMDKMIIRQTAFYGSVVLLLLFFLANLFAWSRQHILTTHDTAVVMTELVTVKSSPTQKSADAFVIHEGTTFDIVDRDIKDWYGIKLSDGREGWILTKDAEEI